MKTTEERALDAVRSRNTEHSDFRVLSVVPKYLDGTLYMIGFKDSSKTEYENYAYVPDDENQVHIYRNTVMLANGVSIHHRRTSTLEKIFNVGGMAGCIAVLITVTICYLTLSKQEFKIPEVLSNALTIILGFYFGTKTTKGRAES